MAFNLSKLKALFGKLAPMADDVAGAIANYGDDAARIAQHTGDPLGGFVETGPLGNIITHYMNEAALCDRVVVINEGKIEMDGTPGAIFSEVASACISITAKSTAPDLSSGNAFI